MPHERTQSVRLTQGPLQRRLGLATVHVDLPPGSFSGPGPPPRADGGPPVGRGPGRTGPRRPPSRPTRALDDGARIDRRGFDPWSAGVRRRPLPRLRRPARARPRSPGSSRAGSSWSAATTTSTPCCATGGWAGPICTWPPTSRWAATPDPPHLEPFWTLIRDGMLDVEPPDHTRLRRLVSAAFTARRVESLRPRIDQLAGALVDDLLDAGSDGSAVDLKAVVAEPLPVAVIAEMLGVPAADQHLLRPWSADICGMYELEPSRATQDTAVRAVGRVLRLPARARPPPPRPPRARPAQRADPGRRRRRPAHRGRARRHLRAAAQRRPRGDRQRDRQRLVGAAAPPRRTRAPARRPGRCCRRRIEELMRYDTPLQMFERWVLEDFEVHGTTLSQGVEVALLFGSANRDPARFPDPDRLDLSRTGNAHLSFGAGVHFCLGAPLARAGAGVLVRRGAGPGARPRRGSRARVGTRLRHPRPALPSRHRLTPFTNPHPNSPARGDHAMHHQPRRDHAMHHQPRGDHAMHHRAVIMQSITDPIFRIQGRAFHRSRALGACGCWPLGPW